MISNDLTVIITDVHRPPALLNLPCNISVPEDVGIGSTVFQVVPFTDLTEIISQRLLVDSVNWLS